jgi:hypothetical protein
VHRFGRPNGPAYPLTLWNKIKNYFIGHTELNLDVEPIYEHFKAWASKDQLDNLFKESVGEPQKKLWSKTPEELISKEK